MAKVFVSYSRQSESVARTVADDVEALGHTVWFDHKLSGGQVWWDQILATTRGCDIFVFVLDPESLASTACKREYGYAADLGKPILPVLVSEGVSVNLLPPALSQVQFVDYRKQDRDAAFRLARALATVPAAKPLPDPLPPAPEAPISYLGTLTEQVETTSTLSFAQQSALLVDLRRSVRDPETEADARMLLQKLRRRRDLLATIAEDIDELLGSVRVIPPIPPRQREKEPPLPEQPRVENPVPQFRPAQGQKPPRDVPAASSKNDPKLTIRDRALGAAQLGGIAVLVGLLLGEQKYSGFSVRLAYYSFPLAIGGTIAGAICGTRARGRVGALIGMGVAVFLRPLFPYMSLIASMLPVFAPPLGALIGVVTRRKVSPA
jgi:hypothetical protein